MASIEQREVELSQRLGPRWYGPSVIKASTSSQKLGQVRRAWYQNGILEEVTCAAPGGSGTPYPETWLVDTREEEPVPDPPPDLAEDLLQVWQWGPPYAAERNLQEICATAVSYGFSGIVLKCMDGLDWAASYFAGQGAPGSLDQVIEQHAYALSRGLKYYAGVNPLYFSNGQLDAEGQIYGQLALATDGLVLDVEPYEGFWGAWRPVGYAQHLMQTIRSVAPASLLVFQPDPRTMRLEELRPEEWIPFCDVIAGQHYWTDFQTNPSQELLNAQQLGHDWGKTVWPTLPGNAPASDFPREMLQDFPGTVLWRLGTANAEVLSVIGGLRL